MTRVLRLVLALVLLALPGAAFAQPAAAVIRLGVLPAEVAGEAFYAADMGFFRKAGIEVQIEPFSNGSSIAAAVAGGALDVGLSDLMSVINAHARGLPFVYLAPGLITSVKAPTFGVVVPAGSPIRSARDLGGKSVAVSGLQNIAQISVSAWIDANGGDAKSVKFVEIPFPALVPALAQGTIQAAMSNEPWITLALDSGDRLMLMDKNPLAPAFLLSGWVTTRDWVQRNPETAAKFTAAIREAAQWANANPQPAAPILSKYTKIPPAVIARMLRGEFAERFEAGLVQPVIDAAARYGVIAKAFPAAEIIAAPR